MAEIELLVERARGGDLAAYGKLVEVTQQMVFAVCYRVLRNRADALDATQETYLRAFDRLKDLRDSAAWPGWLRRIAVTVARSIAKKRRFAFIQTADVPDIPVFDEDEKTWSESQRQALAQALLQLAPEDRRICDRFYHGGWDIARLAAEARVSEPAMRKRLQRIRDRLRKDAEMSEQQNIGGVSLPANMPAQVVELLARPKLVDLPENPVGKIAEILKARYAGHQWIDVPETVEVEEARRVTGNDRFDLPRDMMHFVDPNQFLRYDITLPMLIAAKNCGVPARLIATGQVYRNQTPNPMREQSFHQLEILILDSRDALDPWAFMGETLHVIADLLPGRDTMIESVDFPDSSRAWEISARADGNWVSVLAWGIYTDAVVKHLGGDPARHRAFGLGYGLERMAALHFGYDDIRKLATARV
jgi:RNA polymerase sigma-70 factor (ECF subfamily)